MPPSVIAKRLQICYSSMYLHFLFEANQCHMCAPGRKWSTLCPRDTTNRPGWRREQHDIYMGREPLAEKVWPACKTLLGIHIISIGEFGCFSTTLSKIGAPYQGAGSTKTKQVWDLEYFLQRAFAYSGSSFYLYWVSVPPSSILQKIYQIR